MLTRGVVKGEVIVGCWGGEDDAGGCVEGGDTVGVDPGETIVKIPMLFLRLHHAILPA